MLLSWQPTTAQVDGAGPRAAQLLASCQPFVVFISPAPVLCSARSLLQIPFFPSSYLNWGTNPSVLIAFLSSFCLQFLHSEVVISNTLIVLMLIFICCCDPKIGLPCFSCIYQRDAHHNTSLFKLMLCILCSFFAFLHSSATPWS